ncbi:MAG: phosphotransferase [Cyclobacteriaceae bacterium]|nr:phosphotransferase [Cyclobacteriaceae bacterium]
MNIEHPSEIIYYLKEKGLLPQKDIPQIIKLEGGVSNRTILIAPSSGNKMVVKQALPKLRVKSDWFSSPERIHREALGLRWLKRIIPENVPDFLHESQEHHILIMAAVRMPHTNWKADLMGGELVPAHAIVFGRLLAKIHNASTLYPEIKEEFKDTSFFESLRLEPYYRFVLNKVPEAKKLLEPLILATLKRKQALVHGDYSPKNVLIADQQLFLIDHEVIHYGDPAFDVGFALTHFISKAHHFKELRENFLELARLFWESYQGYLHPDFLTQDLEKYSVLHTLGCLWARVAGRSPLEYLTKPQQENQSRMVLELMEQPTENIPELITMIKSKLYE